MPTNYDAWCGALASLIEIGVEGGEFVCADPKTFAVSISSIMDGLAIQSYSRNGRISVGQAQEYLIRHLREGLGLDGGAQVASVERLFALIRW